jgi:hypothetical protein
MKTLAAVTAATPLLVAASRWVMRQRPAYSLS